MSGYSVKTINLLTRAVSIWQPRTYRGGYGVMLCHGAGAPFQYTDLVSQKSSVHLAAAIASSGIPCISGPFGNNAWGNDAAQAQMDEAWADFPNHISGLNTDKLLLLGVSMGAGSAARFARRNPGVVAGIVGIIPAFNYKYEWENVASVRDSISDAWGVVYPEPLPDPADNLANAEVLSEIPQLAAYSTADTVVLPEGVEEYMDAVGGVKQIISTTLDHSDALVGEYPQEDAIEFLLTNGA